MNIRCRFMRPQGRLTAGRAGQSMTEFIIVWPTILLLTLGSLQMGLIYWAKATVNLAAFQAARAGSLENASVSAMEEEFFRSLSPLYTVDATPAAVKSAYEKISKEATDGYIKLERISPASGEFAAYADAALGYAIPNDNLMFRSTMVKAGSQVNIQDANLLKVKVTYGYKLLVPLIKTVIIRILKTGMMPRQYGAEEKVKDPETDPFLLNLYDAGRVPIVAYATVRMQTPAKP
ncbi:MAG: pilus assembly protein [Nitrospinota bacterium]|nr:pilus assembly protein [Nitrospinota bacterium]